MQYISPLEYYILQTLVYYVVFSHTHTFTHSSTVLLHSARIQSRLVTESQTEENQKRRAKNPRPLHPSPPRPLKLADTITSSPQHQGLSLLHQLSLREHIMLQILPYFQHTLLVVTPQHMPVMVTRVTDTQHSAMMI